jgi:hypothetical protein
MLKACLVKELLVGCDRLLVEVVALPVEGHAVSMAGLYMSVQRIVRQVRLCPDKPLDLDRPLPDVKVVPDEQQHCTGLESALKLDMLDGEHRSDTMVYACCTIDGRTQILDTTLAV